MRRDLKELENFISSVSSKHHIVSSIITGEHDRQCINANKLDVKVPNILLDKCQYEIQRVSKFVSVIVNNLWHQHSTLTISERYHNNVWLKIWTSYIHHMSIVPRKHFFNIFQEFWSFRIPWKSWRNVSLVLVSGEWTNDCTNIVTVYTRLKRTNITFYI